MKKLFIIGIIVVSAIVTRSSIAGCGELEDNAFLLCGGGIFCSKDADAGGLKSSGSADVEVSGSCGHNVFSGKPCGKSYSDGSECTH